MILRILPLFSALLLGLLFPLSPSARAADLFLSDEREIYIALDKLNAMGMLPGFMANTRPYNMQAVRAAVQDMPWSGITAPESAGDLGKWIAYYSAPLAIVGGQASFTGSTDPDVRWNDGGISTPEGSSGRFTALGRFEPFPWLSAGGRAVGWLGEGDESGGRLGETSVEIGHKYVSLQAGKITTWYGPGRRGALIFTNNAEPYPGVRLHNPVPIPVRGFFSFMGNIQYDLFFARLDADRPLPNTILSGFRLAVRPNRFLELGVSRAMHFGGDGENESLSSWWRVFANTDVDTLEAKTNQLAAYDIQLTLPFKKQPVQLYFEWGAEDQARGGYEIPRMAKKAILGGVFFPAILGNPNLDLRIEYADNHMDNHGDDWYNHQYTPHRYKGRALGHPMDSDARDFSIQGRWFLLPSTFLEMTVNRTDRFLPPAPMEKTMGFRLEFLGWLAPSLRAGLGFDAERVTNADWVTGSKDNRYACWLDLAWRFYGDYAYFLIKEKP